MITFEVEALARTLFAVEVATITAVLATLFLIQTFRWWVDGRQSGKVSAARAAIARSLENPQAVPEAEMRLAALPTHLSIRLLWEIAPSLMGGSREALADLADRVGLIAWAVDACRSRRWWRRLQGIRLLALLRRDAPRARPLIDDPHPLVRAQAVEWAAEFANRPALRKLVGMFDDPSALCRFTLQDALLRVGRPTVPAVLDYLTDRGGESSPAALAVAAGLAEPRFLPVALRLSRAERARIREGAATLLAGIGGVEAEDRLADLLHDPFPGVRSAAARGLGDLGSWQKATGLAELLADAEWGVRREAGLALRSLGAPGQLLLQRYQRRADPEAMEMIRHVLDLPGALHTRSA